jgi:ankyrin repeat protein
VKKLIIIVMFPLMLLSFAVYFYLKQEFTYHLHYIAQENSVLGTVSELWLESCPSIRADDAEPNSLLGAVVAGREILNSKFSTVLKIMIRCGADIEQRDSIGFTPLHAAILYSDPIAVNELLKLGANKKSKLINEAAKKYGAVDAIQFASQVQRSNETIIKYLVKLP